MFDCGVVERSAPVHGTTIVLSDLREPARGSKAPDLSLFLVTDTRLCGDRGVVETVRAAVHGGVSAVQVREPGADTRELFALAQAVHRALDGTGVPLFVNDRIDVALAVDAEGVHLGQKDLPVPAARSVAAGRHLLIGLTVSDPHEVAAARALAGGPPDYLGLSPIFTSSTKPEAGKGLGLEGIRALRSAADGIPCVAIGGITAANADAVRSTGVDGLAVVSALCCAPDPVAAARELRG